MIIGVDVREGVRPQRAGKGEYVHQLVTELIKHTEHKFVLFTDAPVPTGWNRAHVRTLRLPASPWLWQLLTVAHLEFVRSVDVYLSTTSLIVPALARSRPVVTVLFDFVSFLFPATHFSKAVLWEKLFMRPALRFSRHLLVISEHTKQDATRLFGVASNKMTVTHLAPAFSAQQTEIEPLAQPTILFVGTLEPRKNLGTLIEAFNQLRNDGVDANLVLAGRWGWQGEVIREAIAASPHADQITVMGHVPDHHKLSLYRRATVLAFPSLYEGFGMPPLEAMSVGLPVVASHTSSLPEVVGEAGVLVSPTSPTELSSALKSLLTSPAQLARFSELGRQRADRFSWSRTARLTLDALQQFK